MDDTSRNLEATLARFNAGQDRVVRDFGYEDTQGGLGVTKECLEPLKVYIQTRLDNLPNLTEGSEEKAMLFVVRNLSAEVLAFATLGGALAMVSHDTLEISTSTAIGSAIHGECWAAGLLENDKALAAKIEQAVRRRHGNLKYRKQAARSIAAKAGYRGAQWPKKQLIACGRVFMGYLISALPDVFVLAEGEPVEGKRWPSKRLAITETGLAIAEAAVEMSLRHNAVFLPATRPLKPWTNWFDGGDWDARSDFRRPLIRARHKESKAVIKAALHAGTMQAHVDALNTLQSVAWTINERVLGVIKHCYENNVVVKGLPPLANLPMPPKPAAWETLDDDAKRVWKTRASKTKQYNRSFVSNRMLMKHDLETAALMSEAGKFWTPLNCDWRGRVYSIPHFNFQRDDRVRALFLFAEGQPIGEEGLKWLKVHCANCGDFDKVSKQSIEERLEWTEANISKIEQMTWTPTKDLWWSKADKPFLFLAACFELISAMATGSSYVTRLPISFDGSCSGLQHLSAMTRDENTAALVNLLPGQKPQDVYQTVATAVATRVSQDAATHATADLAIAKLWLEYGITRKLVKRNVMTYSYSSKKFGMAQQLMEDLMRPLEFDCLVSGKTHPFASPGDCYVDKDGKHKKRPDGHACAKYLAGIVFDAIEALVHRPAQAMKMLQKCARALAHEGKPVSWTTPLGLPWINRYHEMKMQTLNLWLHDARVQMVYADGHEAEIDKERAANGVAPNFVHACDATHLLMVASASACEDITQVATVHDSFGCLAPQAARFRQIIREQFVKLYEHNDVLMQVLGQSRHDLTVHNTHRLPEAPAMGKLKLEEVLNADYAFA